MASKSVLVFLSLPFLGEGTVNIKFPKTIL